MCWWLRCRKRDDNLFSCRTASTADQRAAPQGAGLRGRRELLLGFFLYDPTRSRTRVDFFATRLCGAATRTTQALLHVQDRARRRAELITPTIVARSPHVLHVQDCHLYSALDAHAHTHSQEELRGLAQGWGCDRVASCIPALRLSMYEVRARTSAGDEGRIRSLRLRLC